MQEQRIGGFNMLPPVIKNLLIINGLFFFADIMFETSFNIQLKDILGLHLPIAEKFEPWQFITYMFMHGDFSHIFFNMFALWMFGRTIEEVWGAKRFLIYYFVTGVGAAIVHYAVIYAEMIPIFNAMNQFLDHPTAQGFIDFTNSDYFRISGHEASKHYSAFAAEFNNIVNINERAAVQLAVEYMNTYRIDLLNAPNVVGASGAVYGLLLAFGMLFPNVRIYIYFLIPMKAKHFVLIFGIAEFFMGMTESFSNVAHFAHLGGMLFGYFLIRYWRKKSIY